MSPEKDQTDSIKIRYQGLHPTDELTSFLEGKMNEIHSEAPYDSFLQSHFMRLGEREFKANIHISSPAGSFFASAGGTSLEDVVKKCVTRIRKQLARWKTQRFENEDTQSFGAGIPEPDGDESEQRV
jgi:ribosome-associated translation inhibitor RaiA